MSDSAFILKQLYEKGEMISPAEAKKMLEESALVSKLLVEPKQRPNTFVGVRALEWRLLELAEIPYIYHLKKVQEWVQLLVRKSYLPDGFSLAGDRDGLLACHNAMITTILIKMGYEQKEQIDAGIRWILAYQSVARGEPSKWPGKDLYSRFGGCMKAIPCFYGVVKSMIALTAYKKHFPCSEELNEKLSQGLQYILEHRVYQRLSNQEPIDASIILNFYPYTYKTNIIEILSLLRENGLYEDERCNQAINLLKKKQREDGTWQADVSYMKSAWVEFDQPKKSGEWITYIVEKLLSLNCEVKYECF